VSVVEGRQRLAQLGTLKLTRAESSAPLKQNRRADMSDEKAVSGTKFSARSINKDLKIKILTAENPRRKGTATFDMFNLYKDGMTVAEYLAAGGRLIDVKADVERKHIELVA